MTYIFKNLTKNKIKALFYIMSNNNKFKEHLNPSKITDKDSFFRAMQVRNSYNEVEYVLSLSEDNCIHVGNIDGLLDIKYELSELHLVVVEYDDILNSISFQDNRDYYRPNNIGVWARKVNGSSDDLDWLKFLEYVKLFADSVED